MSAPVALLDANVLYDVVLPDADDRHVLAAAITAQADAIVTLNLRDFPQAALRPYGIAPCSPDQFVGMLGDVAPERVLAAARACRGRLLNPPLSADAYLGALTRHGLTATTVFLRQHEGAL